MIRRVVPRETGPHIGNAPIGHAVAIHEQHYHPGLEQDVEARAERLYEQADDPAVRWSDCVALARTQVASRWP